MIDKATIEHIASLARLELSDTQAQEFSEQLSKALSYFQQISELDTKQVEPLITPVELKGFWREDISESKYTAEQIVENAPDKSGNLFKVPPVV